MTIGTLSRGVALKPQLVTSTPSTAYWGRYLCKQSVGNVEDSSGNARTAILDSALVTAGTAWTANVNNLTCLSDASGGDGGASIPRAQIDIDLRIHSLIWMCRALIPSSVTAAEQMLGYGGGAVGGVTMQKRVTGHELQLRINRGSSLSTGVATGLALNDDAFHNVVMAVDGPAQIGFGWVDGILQFSNTSLASAGTSAGIAATDATQFGFGHEGIGTGTTIPIRFDVIQLFKFNGNLPAYLARGALWLSNNPFELIPDWMWPAS